MDLQICIENNLYQRNRNVGGKYKLNDRAFLYGNIGSQNRKPNYAIGINQTF